MTRRILLTIDDSPSVHTTALVDFLTERGIPAILFCRGDRIESLGEEALLYALQKGMVLAHHSYAHQPAGAMGYQAWYDDFLRMDAMLSGIHAKAAVQWTRKLYRFPYVDRGDGDRIERRFPDLAKGEPIKSNAEVRRIQACLAEHGYHQDLGEVNHPLYQNPDVSRAHDCLFTYSSCDWMLTRRHQGHHMYHCVQDLKQAINDDVWLARPDYDHIALFHDEAEIHQVTTSLIQHMMDNKFEFVERF